MNNKNSAQSKKISKTVYHSAKFVIKKVQQATSVYLTGTKAVNHSYST